MASHPDSDAYVCAFRGRRDSYQVPRALAESGKLDQFITDVYAFPAIERLALLLPAPWGEKLMRRQDSAIPDPHVRCLWGATAWEWTRHAFGMSGASTYAALDPVYSRAAAARARRTRSHFLLYTPYAWEAFQESYSHQPHRVLFQYHPHGAYEREVLQEDMERFPELNFDVERRPETGPNLTEAQRQRVEEVWRPADRILCASTFTKRTMIEAGASPKNCSVIPYGVDLPDPPPVETTPPSDFEVLFVGSGIQRKGLHHLLYAWQRADLPEGSHLTLVCREIESALLALAEDTPDTTLHRGVSFEMLISLYRQHALFAMPSLIEGFGQVYLEAMSQGCPVLGTPNTCLPDIEAGQDIIYTVEPGDIDGLVSTLESLSTVLPGNQVYRNEAQACAEQFTWAQFRDGIIEAV